MDDEFEMTNADTLPDGNIPDGPINIDLGIDPLDMTTITGEQPNSNPGSPNDILGLNTNTTSNLAQRNALDTAATIVPNIAGPPSGDYDNIDLNNSPSVKPIGDSSLDFLDKKPMSLDDDLDGLL